MTPEGKVKKQVKEFLDSLGEDCWYYCPVPSGYGKKGVPDIIGCFKGKFFGIELKAPGKLATDWQVKQLQDIYRAGGESHVACDVAKVKERLLAL